MKELKEFTVERLEAIANNSVYQGAISEIQALAKIALAAKQAKPDFHLVRLKLNDSWGDEVILNAYETQLDASKCKDDHGGEIIPAYTTPPLSHTEQDRWTKIDAANAALVMLDRIETIDPVDDDRIEGIKSIIHQLAAAPKPEM